MEVICMPQTQTEKAELVKIRPDKIFLDDRGWLFEMLRNTDEIMNDFQVKQVTVSHLNKGIVKAFHMHKNQTDIVTCVKGNVKLIVWTANKDYEHLRDTTPEDIRRYHLDKKEILFLGEKNPVTVMIPPNTFHGYTTVGDDDATIVYITNQTYDLQDELRLPWDVLGKSLWEVENR